MKQLLNILGLATLCTASCLAQTTPNPPSVPSKPASPISPDAPTPAARPVMRERETENDVAENLRRVDEELKKLNFGDMSKLNFAFADSYNEGDGPARTLIIPQDVADAKNQSDTEEDLNVMAHILEKASASRDERNARAVGIFFRSPFGGAPSLRNLYLEGYGAIFFLNVNYSLTPASAKSDDSDTKDPVATEWEEARRELSHPRGGRTITLPEQSYNSDWAPAREYDADKVEALKRNLSQALTNAVHIRKLKSDESITIVVSSRNTSGATKLARVKNTSQAKAQSDARSTRDKLIIRARKSDVEEFQNQKLSFEDFRKRLVIFPG